MVVKRSAATCVLYMQLNDLLHDFCAIKRRQGVPDFIKIPERLANVVLIDLQCSNCFEICYHLTQSTLVLLDLALQIRHCRFAAICRDCCVQTSIVSAYSALQRVLLLLQPFGLLVGTNAALWRSKISMILVKSSKLRLRRSTL